VTLIDQSSPANPAQFASTVQIINELQQHVNNVRSPIGHLSQQSNIAWTPDNLPSPKALGWPWLLAAFVAGLAIGTLV
jgi:hypothetical protein